MDKVLVDGYKEYSRAEHRKEFGQYFTPSFIAEYMSKWIHDGPNKGVHDPAFGLGAFAEFFDDIQGSEIDHQILDYYNTYIGDINNIYREDYLLAWDWDNRKYPNIICNPPYMKFQDYRDKDLIIEGFRWSTGIKLSGYTNISSLFLLKAMYDLEINGRLAFIMPLEFLNTGYGKIVKKVLLENNHLHSIMKIEFEDEVFPDAITSVGIIFYDSSKKYKSVKFLVAESKDDLYKDINPISDMPYYELKSDEKWQKYFNTDILKGVNLNMVKMSTYGKFSRGIATGANEFFVLNPSKAKSMLKEWETVEVIPKSSYVTNPIFSLNDYLSLSKEDKNVLLLDSQNGGSDGLEEYIRYGESKEYHKRYLTKNRKLWHNLELENKWPALIWVSVFSRDGYKIIRNHSDALNLTCFHGFIPTQTGSHYVDHLFLFMLSDIGQKLMRENARIYGAKLHKFEPGDLNDVKVPSKDMFHTIPINMIYDNMNYVRKHGAIKQELNNRFTDMVLDRWKYL